MAKKMVGVIAALMAVSWNLHSLSANEHPVAADTAKKTACGIFDKIETGGQKATIEIRFAKREHRCSAADIPNVLSCVPANIPEDAVCGSEERTYIETKADRIVTSVSVYFPARMDNRCYSQDMPSVDSLDLKGARCYREAGIIPGGGVHLLETEKGT